MRFTSMPATTILHGPESLHPLSSTRGPRGTQRLSKPHADSPRVGALVAVGLHAAAVAAILSYEPARSTLIEAAPIMVDWITPPKPPEIRPRPPAVQPHLPKPVEQPRIVEQVRPLPVAEPALVLTTD